MPLAKRPMDELLEPPPCCSASTPRHIRELPDVAELVALNVYQCVQCQRYWVDVWLPWFDNRFWEGIPTEDLQTILHTNNQNWMKLWADHRDLIP